MTTSRPSTTLWLRVVAAMNIESYTASSVASATAWNSGETASLRQVRDAGDAGALLGRAPHLGRGRKGDEVVARAIAEARAGAGDPGAARRARRARLRSTSGASVATTTITEPSALLSAASSSFR